MDLATDRRDDRFFRGDATELQKIKNRENLEKFERQKRRRELLRKLARVMLFVGLFAAFIAVCLNFFFVVKTVEVVGCDRYTGDELIALSGIEYGDSLFSFSQKSIDSLPARLANIRRVQVKRQLPTTLVYTLTEDNPRYYTELYGEYFVLSDELRVLERVFDEAPLRERGLLMLRLPEINFAIVGSNLVFDRDSDERYVKAYLDAANSSALISRINAFDLRDRFNLKLICSDFKYLAELSDGTDLATKLSTLAQVVAHEALAEKGKARIDIADPSEARVIFDIGGDITFDS